jgi:CAAX prenyl protease-like protein
MAAAEVVIVFCTIILFIWRLQFTFPEFAWFILLFLISTFLVHRDSLQQLGLGSQGLHATTKALVLPTAIIALVLITIAVLTGGIKAATPAAQSLSGFGRYFAWALFQEFGLQSFFTNRILEVLKDAKKSAWVSGMLFAAFHIPNPVLIPLTFAGGVIFSRIFIHHRNILPLALSHAIIGSLASVAIPVAWHHGLRVGPAYYW